MSSLGVYAYVLVDDSHRRTLRVSRVISQMQSTHLSWPLLENTSHIQRNSAFRFSTSAHAPTLTLVVAPSTEDLAKPYPHWRRSNPRPLEYFNITVPAHRILTVGFQNSEPEAIGPWRGHCQQKLTYTRPSTHTHTLQSSGGGVHRYCASRRRAVLPFLHSNPQLREQLNSPERYLRRLGVEK